MHVKKKAISSLFCETLINSAQDESLEMISNAAVSNINLMTLKWDHWLRKRLEEFEMLRSQALEGQ